MQSDGDMHVFFGDGADSYFADYHSVGYKPPKIDDNQDLVSDPAHPPEMKNDGEKITLVARRALDTGDEQDFVIPLDEEFTMGYAFNGESHELSYSTKHDTAGSVAITIRSDGTPVWDSSIEAEPVNSVSNLDAIESNLTYKIEELFGDSGLTVGIAGMATILAAATF